MRDTKVIEEEGYFMAFATDDGKHAVIGESHDRDAAIKQANELADLLNEPV